MSRITSRLPRLHRSRPRCAGSAGVELVGPLSDHQRERLCMWARLILLKVESDYPRRGLLDFLESWNEEAVTLYLNAVEACCQVDGFDLQNLGDRELLEALTQGGV